MATMKVRGVVAVNGAGKYAFAGWSDVHEKTVASVARDRLEYDPLGTPEAVYFIEAEVPIPEATVVQGTVVGKVT